MGFLHRKCNLNFLSGAMHRVFKNSEIILIHSIGAKLLSELAYVSCYSASYELVNEDFG